MKKITNLELSSLILFQEITLYLGIISSILKTSNGINSWIPLIISFIIGLIPILLFIYINNYETNLNIKEKLNNIKGGKILNIILSILFLIIGITILYNVSNFITSQLLYRTPTIICSILLVSLIVYHSTSGINSISKISIIMIIFNIILYILSFTSIIKDANINNILPILKEDNNNIILTSIKIMSIHTLPILLLGIIPKDNIYNKKNYNKTIIISYIIGAYISISICIIVILVLGPYLINLFEYPEYIILERIKILGFLERIENIVSNQWIIGSYIYLSLIVYYISNNNKNNNKIINIIIGIILLLSSTYIFKSNTMYDSYIKYIFPYICLSLIIFYIILTIYTYINKKKNKKVL